MWGRGVKNRVLGVALAAGLVPGMAFAQQVEVGVIAPMTGAGSPWGYATSAGVQIAADEINAAGGLEVGGKKYTVKVTTYDDEYKAPVAVTAMRRMISDKIKYVFGPLGSPPALAVKPLAEENNVLLFTGTYTRKILDKDSKNVFRMYSTPAEFSVPLINWLKKEMPADKRRVAILDANDEAGWDAADLLKSRYTAAEFQVVSTEFYERSAKDFQAILTKLLAAKPDVIEFGYTSPATAGLIVRQAREMGYKGQFIKCGASAMKEVIAAAGEGGNGMINYLMSDSTSPEHARLATAYSKKYSGDMNEMLVPFYDAARILFAAMQKAGDVNDVAKVRAAIPAVMPFKSVLGEQITIGGKADYGVDNQFYTPAFVGQIVGGQPKIVGVAK